MDFKDQIHQLGERVEKLKNNVKTEEATKNAFIMPFIQCLGYDVFNPAEVVPEFTADFGIKQGEKVDYAIVKDGEPTILIECKCHLGKLELHNSQLFRYFSTTSAKFGLLTNGIEFRFYTDLVEKNKMDEKPFFIFNILDIKDNQVEELKKFHKTYFDLDKISTSASELKYLNELRSIISSEMADPSTDFVTYLARRVYPSHVTQKVVGRFTPLVKRAFSQYTNDLITDRLKTALDKELEKQSDQNKEEDPPEVSKVITTEDEKEAYFIIKSILRPHVDIERILLKDNQTYCAIQLDNSWHQIARLYFNGSKIFFVTFNEKKKEIRHNIEALDDIYKFSDKIIDSLKIQLSK